MELERATEIVRAINARAMVTAGLDVALGNLKDISLAEMLEAKAAVMAANVAAAAHQKEHGGSYSVYMVPDDRLIAAVYVLGHFAPSRDPILCLPFPSFNGTHVAVACVAVTPEPEAGEDEED
ncbi:hypothetical protein V5F63_12645 [Xanthobacter autotrophicus DSM 597]|uniref:hypothetical protein n=1 Tax=Xanthobacter wiegelii TaxID=3119913 RepID=UPI00372CA0FE